MIIERFSVSFGVFNEEILIYITNKHLNIILSKRTISLYDDISTIRVDIKVDDDFYHFDNDTHQNIRPTSIIDNLLLRTV